MAKFYDEIGEDHQKFIAEQEMYFTATAAQSGRVNLSPKGLDSFRCLDSRRVAYLDLTGSGNETAAHTLDTNRITLMFCSFKRNPKILRIYGSARSIKPRDSEWEDLYKDFPKREGARQIFVITIYSVQTSCGFGVPLYDYVGQRDTLEISTQKLGDDGVRAYWQDKNRTSIDGLPTGLVE